MKNNLSKFLLAVLIVTILFILPFHILQTQDQFLKSTKQVLGSEIEKEKLGEPRYLRIPKINVEADVVEVGLTPYGNMGVPKSAFDIGWFNLGSRPGELGSSVMTGHFNSKDGKAGVFFDLYKLKTGDKLYVEDANKIITVFVVRESRIYDSGYAEEVFSSNDGFHLNLVTCDGVWDGVKESYSKRLVVFADITN